MCGCHWLARILEKAKLKKNGLLPEDYQRSFCQPNRVDGYFLSFFSIDEEELLNVCEATREEIQIWFTSHKGVSSQKIEKWNNLSENFGKAGFPMHERLPVALSTIYKNVSHLAPQTVFQVLEADEKAEEDL